MNPSHETWAEFRDRMRERETNARILVAVCLFAAMMGVAFLTWIG